MRRQNNRAPLSRQSVHSRVGMVNYEVFRLGGGAAMTNIHLIGGEKGGVGKSLVARLLAQYLIDRSIPFIGFDTDRTHGALLRFYAGYASSVLMDNYESLDAIVEAASEK